MPDPNANTHAGYSPFRSADTRDEPAEWGSLEVFWDDEDRPGWSDTPRNYDVDGNPVKAGWYWWPCFPDCLPDGDASGPFETSAAAYLDAQGY